MARTESSAARRVVICFSFSLFTPMSPIRICAVCAAVPDPVPDLTGGPVNHHV